MDFKKLNKGGIVFVTSTNPAQRSVYGYNVLSPKLKQKCFSDSEIDKDWQEDVDLIRSIFEKFHSNWRNYEAVEHFKAYEIDNKICRLENLKHRRLAAA